MNRTGLGPSPALKLLAVNLILLTLFFWTQAIKTANVSGSITADRPKAAMFVVSLIGLIVTGHIIVPKSQSLGVACLTIGYGILAIGTIVPGCR